MSGRLYERYCRMLCRPLWLFSISLLTGCAAAVDSDVRATPNRTIYVADHGWHTGIVIEAGAVLSAMPGLRRAFPVARYVEFGWGDRDFYRAREVDFGLAAKALLVPTDAVLHVAVLSDPPDLGFSGSKIVALVVDADALNELLSFIRAAFEYDRQGDFIPAGPGLYPGSLFFEARGTYHAFYTCNSWVMDALVRAGLPEPPLPVLSASGVMVRVEQYRNGFGREQPKRPK
ncbi:MAG: DUF2459 domain-containing protein [Gammaproteobacteria bacterium]